MNGKKTGYLKSNIKILSNAAVFDAPPHRQSKLRCDVNKLLETTARTKVARYREAYANRLDTTYAFLPCVMSSGRIRVEFHYICDHRDSDSVVVTWLRYAWGVIREKAYTFFHRLQRSLLCFLINTQICTIPSLGYGARSERCRASASALSYHSFYTLSLPTSLLVHSQHIGGNPPHLARSNHIGG